jgi:hypothetical protein
MNVESLFKQNKTAVIISSVLLAFILFMPIQENADLDTGRNYYVGTQTFLEGKCSAGTIVSIWSDGNGGYCGLKPGETTCGSYPKMVKTCAATITTSSGSTSGTTSTSGSTSTFTSPTTTTRNTTSTSSNTNTYSTIEFKCTGVKLTNGSYQIKQTNNGVSFYTTCPASTKCTYGDIQLAEANWATDITRAINDLCTPSSASTNYYQCTGATGNNLYSFDIIQNGITTHGLCPDGYVCLFGSKSFKTDFKSAQSELCYYKSSTSITYSAPTYKCTGTIVNGFSEINVTNSSRSYIDYCNAGYKCNYGDVATDYGSLCRYVSNTTKYYECTGTISNGRYQLKIVSTGSTSYGWCQDGYKCESGKGSSQNDLCFYSGTTSGSTTLTSTVNRNVTSTKTITTTNSSSYYCTNNVNVGTVDGVAQYNGAIYKKTYYSNGKSALVFAGYCFGKCVTGSVANLKDKDQLCYDAGNKSQCYKCASGKIVGVVSSSQCNARGLMTLSEAKNSCVYKPTLFSKFFGWFGWR